MGQVVATYVNLCKYVECVKRLCGVVSRGQGGGVGGGPVLEETIVDGGVDCSTIKEVVLCFKIN